MPCILAIINKNKASHSQTPRHQLYRTFFAYIMRCGPILFHKGGGAPVTGFPTENTVILVFY